MTTIEYTLPSFLACYLFYGDNSSMDDEEIVIIDDFMTDNGLGFCVDVEDIGVCHNHDIYPSFLSGDCSIFTFEKL